ncbi:lamin-B2-like [Thunnus maccoyii]|uniref:lamin-B2-like n=1 Tax=Thunnus maccoyii TaxID=8240 RepID=UPI001C4C1AE9|nr:lamin-B2-like [Thunnus maccoyii]
MEARKPFSSVSSSYNTSMMSSPSQLEASQQKVAELQKQNISYTTIQRSVRGDIFVEVVDLNGEYVSLINKSDKEQELNGCKLQMRVNDGEPIIFRCDSYKLKAGQTITIWAPDCGVKCNPAASLKGWNQKSWGPEDKLLVTLLSCSGEEMATNQTQADIMFCDQHY